MGFKDIFKKSFLNGFANSEINTKTILICLCITAVLALYIFFVYKLLVKKSFYDRTFNLSLVGMAVITVAIILTIQSNVVLSLGMVGALSIVRFRTAVKNSLDLVFLYWAISVGIICGAGLAEIAVIVSVGLTIIVLIIQKFPEIKASKLLVVNCSNINIDNEIIEIVKNETKKYRVKTRNITNDHLELIIELYVKEDNDLVKKIVKIDGVSSASLLSYDGDTVV